MLHLLWILAWGLAGYFTVRAIKIRIERKRMEKEHVEYLKQRQILIDRMNTFRMIEANSEKME